MDGAEIQLKGAVQEYRRRRDAFIANLEAEKEANLKVKQAIIEELKELVNSDETLNHTFNKFRELQQRWKDTGIVPQQHVKVCGRPTTCTSRIFTASSRSTRAA